MIKLCKNLFYKPKYGSDADSAMLKHLFTTVTTILVCLAAISFSAYAFFSYSVTSGTNTIKASNFSTTVTIIGSDDSLTQGKIQNHTFNPGKYTVKITVDDSTTGTGYGVVTVKDTNTTYYTQQLGVDLNAPGGKRTEISFTLDIKAAVTVNFESRWGTNSLYNAPSTENTSYITNTNPLQTIVVVPAQGVADNDEEINSEETSSTETTSAEMTPTETTHTESTSTESTPTETTPTESISTETTPTETTPTTESDEIIHIVQSGDSLATIAEKYGTTRLILADYNKLDNPSVIQPGQEIHIPLTNQAETSPEQHETTDSLNESTGSPE